MIKKTIQKKESIKKKQKKQLRWFIYIIGSFFIIATILLFYESSQEVSDLSLIGKGKNVSLRFVTSFEMKEIDISEIV